MSLLWNLPKIHLLPHLEWREERPVCLVHTRPAWDAVRERLHLPVVWQAEVLQANQEHWESLFQQVHGEVVYAVGGGLAADAAKYLAARQALPLVCVPTALSVDAFLTWASGVRHQGCVHYLETQAPDDLVVDLEAIAAAPQSLRSAGICDVLSIATGAWDWEFAHRQGMNPPGMEYLPYVAQAARAILQGALDCAEAAGRGDLAGLKQLLDCLALEVQLCNQVGHSRPEEGSEHYFAYAAENEIGPGLPHGELVGPGILVVARLQGQDTAPLLRALQACHIPLDRIPEAVVSRTLRLLPDYVRRHDLPFGIAHTLHSSLIEALHATPPTR